MNKLSTSLTLFAVIGASFLAFRRYQSTSSSEITKKIDDLKLIIFNSEINIYSYITNNNYPGRKFVIRSDSGSDMIDNSVKPFKGGGLNTTAKKIEILIQTKETVFEKIILSENLQNNLLKFLINGPPSPRFCCVDFVNYLFDKYQTRFTNEFDLHKWTVVACEKEKQFSAGDAIVLTQQTDKIIKHFAISLGKNKLFLSVAGVLGDLIITELNPLKKMYETDVVFQISPKSEF